jgi:hypothetical protein
LQSNEGKLAKFKKLKALQKEKSNALSQILDAGQYKKYEEIKDQMVQHIKEKENEKTILSMGNDFVYYHFCMLSKH